MKRFQTTFIIFIFYIPLITINCSKDKEKTPISIIEEVVSTWENGNPKEVSIFAQKNNVKELITKKYFYSNGYIDLEENYADFHKGKSVLHGKTKSWFSDSSLNVEANFHYGDTLIATWYYRDSTWRNQTNRKKVTEWKFLPLSEAFGLNEKMKTNIKGDVTLKNIIWWKRDGNIKSNYTKLGNEYFGRFQMYHDNGNLEYDYFYNPSGQLDKNAFQYYKDGSIMIMETYSFGEIIDSVCWDQDGNQMTCPENTNIIPIEEVFRFWGPSTAIKEPSN